MKTINLAFAWGALIQISLLGGSLTTRAETSVEAWVQRYGTTTDSTVWGEKVVTDANGNVIVLGFTSDYTSDGSGRGDSMVIIKYSSAGTVSWTSHYYRIGYFNVAYPFGIIFTQTGDVTVDSNGNVLATAAQPDGSSGFRYVTVKYSAAGGPVWTNYYNGLPPAYSQAVDLPYGVAVDGTGNVFVTGTSDGGGSNSFDCATIKYSGEGMPLWTNRYNGLASGSADQANALAVDTNGNVVVTGFSGDTNNVYDFVTLKYSSVGLPQWTNRYNGPGNGYDYAQAVALDSGGNVFVTGYSGGGVSGDDYATIKPELRSRAVILK